jgi:hypothetical protein
VPKSDTASTSAAGLSQRVFRLPDGSRSESSPWVWRAMFMLALIALGFCLTFAVGQRALLALAWAVIGVGWFGISMWLWRRHHNWVVSTED